MANPYTLIKRIGVLLVVAGLFVFLNRYTREDIELLAAMDEAHGTLSGPATQKLLQRARHDFGETRYRLRMRISKPKGRRKDKLNETNHDV